MRRHPLLVSISVLLLALAGSAPAQEAGSHIVKLGGANDDLYAAGGTVDVRAATYGDVVAAGGTVTIGDAVHGDVLAAGGHVDVSAAVDDDVRVAGANVQIRGPVRDDLVAAGGRVTVVREATIGGRALLAGGSVAVDGRIAGDLRAAGGQIVIAGSIDGDVDLAGDDIEIAPGAAIRGQLRYWSRQDARIDPAATIRGAIVRIERPGPPAAERRAAAAGLRFGAYLMLAVAVVAYFLLFPVFSLATASRLRQAPWQSLALGLAMIATTPLVAVLLLISLLGLWLALALWALYFVLLLGGVATGVLALAARLLALVRKSLPTRGGQVAAIVAAIVLLWLLGLLPVIGGLAMAALLVFGTGALAMALWQRYRGAA